MARRRMFSLDVVDTDKFLEMSQTAQCLYYHLGMRADDDGFISSPNKIVRMLGCNVGDLQELIQNGYVLKMESGIVVIKHWKVHNSIKSDRYNPTIHVEEKEKLSCSNNVYELESEENKSGDTMETCWSQDGDNLDAKRIQDGKDAEPQDRLGKERKEYLVEQDSTGGVFTEIIAYLNQKTGKNFRVNCKATRRLISSRIEEGFAVSDFKHVIDVKCQQWLGDQEHSKYLRPETLFSAAHFESYLNEVPKLARREKQDVPDEDDEPEMNFWD